MSGVQRMHETKSQLIDLQAHKAWNGAMCPLHLLQQQLRKLCMASRALCQQAVREMAGENDVEGGEPRASGEQ